MTLTKTVALVGMMGAGKTSIGKRLAARLDVPFADADQEIEAAAGMTVAEIFEKYGEPEFRRLERSVIARLLGEGPRVLATGGGATMDETTRAAMTTAAFTIWLKAPVEILLGRVRKRQGADQTRPLLANDDTRGTLERLLA
ncbi:MAG TPA: shikimate kinase, partial [Rhizomicrobium sp.]|nr:shikimate kinase [Rhizomicrobium sp.]